jgi:hypothetical protein
MVRYVHTAFSVKCAYRVGPKAWPSNESLGACLSATTVPSESKKAAAGHNRGFNCLILIPAVQAAVRVENVRKQLVHQIPISPSVLITPEISGRVYWTIVLAMLFFQPARGRFLRSQFLEVAGQKVKRASS